MKTASHIQKTAGEVTDGSAPAGVIVSVYFVGLVKQTAAQVDFVFACGLKGAKSEVARPRALASR